MIFLILPDLPLEDRLLARARTGDQEAILHIYEAYFPAIYQFIRMRVEAPAQAEDIASDVFVKFIQSLKGRTAPRHSLRGWLFQVARNELAYIYGQNKRFPIVTLQEWMPVEGEQANLEDLLLHMLDLAKARKALQDLPAEQQEVLILRFGQALSLEATADLMNKGVGAVKSLQFRALQNLRQRLGEMKIENDHAG